MEISFIKHRVNTIEALKLLEPEFGCEIDLRSNVSTTGEMHLSHDPWQIGDHFKDWIKVYATKGMHGPLILNTKEDGLEAKIIEILNEYKISNYFFLDTTVPTLIKWSLINKNPNFAVRISKYEDQNFALKFKNKINWVWLDCFEGIPPEETWFDQVKANFKICLVSPELQGASLSQIEKFKHLKTKVHAICTKEVNQWMQ